MCGKWEHTYDVPEQMKLKFDKDSIHRYDNIQGKDKTGEIIFTLRGDVRVLSLSLSLFFSFSFSFSNDVFDL